MRTSTGSPRHIRIGPTWSRRSPIPKVRLLRRCSSPSTVFLQGAGDHGREHVWQPAAQRAVCARHVDLVDCSAQELRDAKRDEAQFRAEAYNLFNRANLDAPVTNMSRGDFSQILTSRATGRCRWACCSGSRGRTGRGGSSRLARIHPNSFSCNCLPVLPPPSVPST